MTYTVEWKTAQNTEVCVSQFPFLVYPIFNFHDSAFRDLLMDKVISWSSKTMAPGHYARLYGYNHGILLTTEDDVSFFLLYWSGQDVFK